MIHRTSYFEQILPYMGKPYIKVLTGIRRCGKSSILLLIGEELRDRGIEGGHIININFENLAYGKIRTAYSLREHILDQMKDGQTYYILLDEIQEVAEWERAINSLMVEANVDIYITGSNSTLLSSELASHIAGRYVSIHVKTLSFDEYRTFRGQSSMGQSSLGDSPQGDSPSSLAESFMDYIRRGGFPRMALDNNDYEQDYKAIHDIYSSIVLLDMVQRHGIRNTELLSRVVHFVLDNTGNSFSAKKVSDFFKNQYRSVHIETIYNYLDALESAFIVKRIPRYDLRGKELLKTNEKYYLGDHSLIYALLGYHDHNISGVLENIVLHELERRGYTVYTGKLLDKEIDFVGERRSEKIYIQVTYKLDAEQVVEREFSPLLAIKDSYPKYVLSLDGFWKDSVEGIRHISIPEFLLNKGI